MSISDWFDNTSCEVVNEVALLKKYIVWSIHQENSLRFEKQSYIIREINNMSRKVKEGKQNDAPVVTQKSVVSSKGGSGSKTRWVSADIRTREHKAAVRELSANPNFVLDTVVELIDEGYELHVKRTDEGATVRSMLFCHVRDHANKGGGLSAEAPDAWLSLTALIYKHVNLLQGEWFDQTNDADEDGGWR